MANRSTSENGALPSDPEELAKQFGLALVGPFTGKALNHRLPCTATRRQTCHIVDQLDVWNEFLFDLGYQLREVRGTAGQLSISRFKAKQCPHRFQIALLHWLIATHSCICAFDYSCPPHKKDEADLCETLRRNTSIKIVTVPIWAVMTELHCTTISNLRNLEELVFPGRGESSTTVVDLLTSLLRSSTSLSCLKIPELRMRTEHADAFLKALEANFSLKELSVNSSVISAASPSCRDEFSGFLRNECKLTALTVKGMSNDSELYLRILLDALVHNRSLLKVELENISPCQESADLLRKVAAKNKVLRVLSLSVADACKSKRGLLNCSATSLGELETLEELTLSLAVWDSAHWKLFLESLSAKRNAMKVIIDVGENDQHEFLEVCNDLRQNCAAGTVVSFQLIELISRFDVILEDNVIAKTPRRGRYDGNVATHETFSNVWSSVSSISSLELFCDFHSFSSRGCSLFTRFIRETTALKELTLVPSKSHHSHQDTEGHWRQIIESLAQNTSVVHLDVCTDALDEEGAKCLADAFKRSRNIRRATFWLGETMRYFVPYLAHDIEDNYTLTQVRLDHVTWNGGAYTCRIMDTVRRNFGLVSRASQFLSAGHCDRFCTPHALKTVQMHPALMAELAEVLSVGDTEAADIVRDGIRSLEDDMHVFMRVIGIAGERIECCPRQDGRAQLDSLNEYCLREIRRYLRFEDVKCSSERESGERRQRDLIPFI